MTGIWTNDSERWKLVQPEGFPDEATLHRLIAETPNMLPLAGSPDLVVLASEAQLGTGYADLLAVETTGRPVIVEVKLASNAEARRAVMHLGATCEYSTATLALSSPGRCGNAGGALRAGSPMQCQVTASAGPATIPTPRYVLKRWGNM